MSPSGATRPTTIHDAVIYIRDGRIAAVGPRFALPIPKGAKVIDCTGKYLIPGLIDGFAGMNSQGQASANLYMGVTTVVASGDDRRGHIDQHASPSPHLYLVDSIGSTDDWSLLINRPEWSQKLKDNNGRSSELSPDDTARQLADTAKLGTRVLWLGHDLTAANTQWIIEHAHQLNLVTYGEFISTPYRVAIEAGVDSLLHMSRYELGVIPDELQQPLMDDPEGAASRTAYGYSERLPPGDYHYRNYAHFIALHHIALMPTFSLYYLRLPDHRNLWREPAASCSTPTISLLPPTAPRENSITRCPQLDPPHAQLRHPPDGRKVPAARQISKPQNFGRSIAPSLRPVPTISPQAGAPAFGTMPGISMHTELELLVRLGLSPREALAAATNNYAEQFHWTELGQITPGRRGRYPRPRRRPDSQHLERPPHHQPLTRRQRDRPRRPAAKEVATSPELQIAQKNPLRMKREVIADPKETTPSPNHINIAKSGKLM